MAEAANSGKKNPPYWRYAFHNPYNYALMGGAGTAALLTGNWWLAIAGAGAELLWMLFAPDSALLRKFVWDKQLAGEERQKALARQEAIAAGLPKDRRERFQKLVSTRDHIYALVQENRSIAGDVMQNEITKLGAIPGMYLDLAATAARYHDYLQKTDAADIDKQIYRIERKLKEEDRPALRQNLAVLLQRKEKLREISSFADGAVVQMDLIENTMQLLADQVVTMKSPSELGSQLDDIIRGVESAREATREAERLLSEEVA